MTPIWGVELDPETMERIGEPVALIDNHKTEYGYERSGEEHHYDPSSSRIVQILKEQIAKASGCRPEDVTDVTPAIEATPESYRPLLRAALLDNPYIEGAWMTKHDGRYYLQYAAPGTQYNIYNDGVCVSESPLGPFTACPNNPYSYSPGGFLPGAGHGSTMEDSQGNWWHASTMRISRNHDFERRIGIWPAGFDADGELFCNQRYGDWPQSVTGEKKDPWAAPEWMLLSYGKTATASSCDCPEKDASHVVDENVQTWWKAAGEDAAPWLLVDLGRCCRVHAVQINFADDVETVTELPQGAELTGDPGRGRYIEERSFATRWFLETSTDGEHWFEMEDWRNTDTDLPHNLVVWEDGLPATYIRLTVIDTPYHRPACISGLRVFGRGCGNAPAPVTEAEAARLDGMSMNVTWKEVSSSNEFASWNHASSRSEVAMGYEVLWGHAPEKLYHSYRVFGRTQVEIRALMANVERYYVRIDAFNECGITEGKVFPVDGAV